MKPVRVQLRRTKGWRMPANTVKVDRSTKWGNPLYVGMWRDFTRADAVNGFSDWIKGKQTINATRWGNGFGTEMAKAARKELRGKNLACWCSLDEICHADVLLEIANS